jgi:biopolymer transport protein TolR
MAMSGGPTGGVVNQINVTPLVDVVLVLLIIFMVVTPLLQRGKEVTLPRTHTVTEPKEGKESDPIILSVTQDKRVYVEKLEYDEKGLQQKLENELRVEPDRKLLLKGDASVTFGTVRKVMDSARKAGAKGIGLAVEQLKDK